jgi:hypothetical protein
MNRIPVSGPSITQREIDYVADAVTRCWYGSANEYHDRFEKAFSDYLGLRYAVALAHDNADELPELIRWAHGRDLDVTLIETMPMGEVEADRTDQFLSLGELRRELESFWTLTDIPFTTGGPARYVEVAETGGQLGFITPLSHNFWATDASHDLVRAGESPMLNEPEASGEMSLGTRRMPVTVTSPVAKSLTDSLKTTVKLIVVPQRNAGEVLTWKGSVFTEVPFSGVSG